MGWGDELMAAGQVERLVGGTNKKIAILDIAGRVRTHEAWLNNPHIAAANEQYDATITDGPGRRACSDGVKNNRWVWKKFDCPPAKFYFSAEELAFANSLQAGFVVIEPHTKDKLEKVNRDWGWEKFQQVVDALPQINWVQLGPKSTKLLRNVQHIETQTLRMAAAAMSRARAFMGTEGGLHHTAGALNIPGVVVFGGFVSPKVTGYACHTSLFVGNDLGCGMRQKCKHCQDALSSITPQIVVAEMIKILEN